MAWAMATAAIVSAACAVVGTLLVVRRMSLLGDAISHAILPGIVVAVLAGGRLGGAGSIVGAVVAAGVTVWLSQMLRDRVRLAEDTGAGVVFTTLFALGVVLIATLAWRVDLDPGCALYGILELVPFDTWRIAGVEVPRAFVTAAIVLVGVSAMLRATWPAQVFAAFDGDAARVIGVPVAAATTSLLAATAVVTVASFEAVGSVLVVAMLVVPAASAELLVRSLGRVMAVAVAIAVAGAIAGYLLAWRMNTNAAGMIAVVLGLEYAVAVITAPGDGVIARGITAAWLRWRVACEDVLAAAWRADEAIATGGPPPARRRGPLAAIAGWWLARSGRLVRDHGRARLTPTGRAEAETVVRSHRLWEAWLGRNVELPIDHLHPPAEWVEHYLGAEARRRIEAEVGLASGDPHGREIPTEPDRASGERRQ